MSLLDAIAEVLGRKPAPAVQSCAPGLGAVCIVVTRRDQPSKAVPEAQVSLQGPTPGDHSSDNEGIAEFPNRTPGAYTVRVELPEQRYPKWRMVDYSKGLSVSEGNVTVVEVLVYPTGTLHVEIRHDTGETVRDPADLSASGAETLAARTESGMHTFPEVACGEYEVSGKGTTKAGQWSTVAPRVVVPEGGSVTAPLVVSSLTWIAIELITQDGVGVVGEDYLIVTPDGQEIRGRTGQNGRARIDGIVAGQCKVSFPNLDRDEWQPS